MSMLYNVTYQNAVYERFNPVGKIAKKQSELVRFY